MKGIECPIIAGAALVLLLMFLYPPWMSIDPQSEGRVHGTLGYYAIWDPPPAESVFRALYPDARELPDAERLGGFMPRVNRVRLIINALAVALACSLAIFVLRRIRRSAESAKYAAPK